MTLSSHKTDLCTLTLNKLMHEFLKEIYHDFCTKYDVPWNEDGSDYLSADDLLHGHMYAEIEPLTQYQQNWLCNYIKLWEATTGGEDI